jgi:hypothetical protein
MFSADPEKSLNVAEGSSKKILEVSSSESIVIPLIQSGMYSHFPEKWHKTFGTSTPCPSFMRDEASFAMFSS